MRVLMVAPHIHRDATGEEFVAYKWAEALSEHLELTVFAFQDEGKVALGDLLPNARVVTTPRPSWATKLGRLEAMAKPSYPVWAARLKRWLKHELRQGVQYDVAHQIMPQAPRYVSPLRGFGIPYILGPYGGLLETPEGFAAECATAKWYTRFRVLDQWRLSWDPFLRRSISEAQLVLGVAPYVAQSLASVPLCRFETVLELGVENVPAMPDRTSTGRLTLLHVGRGVRTKGLRDVVRAMGYLKDVPGLHLISAGEGEEIPICKQEAERLAVADRIEFLGQLPRNKIEDLYKSSDIFVFPSFREPAGNVVYEAMSWGLPVIAAARGGPDSIVDETTGLKVAVSTPDAMARDVAAAIRTLVENSDLRCELGAGGRQKLLREGLWQTKARHMLKIYESVSGA